MFRVFALAVLALLAPLEGGGVMFAATQILLGRCAKAAWRNPYVTNGLVVMWDGEWNVGGGVHDSATKTWKDLIGGTDLDIAENSFGDKWFNATKAIGASYPTASIIGNVVRTVEFVFESNASSNSIFLCLGGSSNDYKLGLYYTRPSDGSTPHVCCIAQPISANINLATDRHISERLDGSSVSMFINGEPTETFSGGNRASGQISVGGRGGRTASLNGKVFCVRAYSKILSESELAANYAVDKARFNLP